MKFLVLSCNTGGGHNSAARAVQEKFIQLGHECDVKDALRYCSKLVSSGVSSSYNNIVLHTPKAFGVGYRYSKSIVYKGDGKLKSPVYAINMSYSKRLCSDVIENGYDAVVCTHLFPAQAITHAKHKHGLDVPVYVVATDYSFSPFYDELDVNKFFVSMKEVKHEYIERGIPEGIIIPSGIPVSTKFNLDISRQMARAELGLNQNKFICLIMSGSMGFGNIYKLIDEIIKKPLLNYEILVIAGNNNKLRNGINERYAKYENIASIGFTDQVHLYMRASNLVITKPGGLSSTESMVSNVPLILINPIPGCESENYALLTKLGAALEGDTVEKAVFAFESVLLDEVVAKTVVNKQRQYINPLASSQICETIINDINY